MTCRYPYCDAGGMGAFCSSECHPSPNCIGHDCEQCRQRDGRRLTDEVIADLWHKNGGFHHHFARHIERWLKGGA